MLITPLLLLLPVLVGAAFGAQLPLLAANVPPSTELEPGNLWDLERAPSVNATGHLVFLSVGSLLQHWPNTLYRNGHTLVPGTVAPGMLLYHGTWKHEIPSLPNWVATDPEHANLFCAGNKTTGCWQLTLMTTRELNVLYFDGSSAAKMDTGTMDSQDIVIWGEPKPGYTPEGLRIKELCEWGARRDVDGFVRMEMNFEIMLCDFSKGTRVVAFLNLVATEEMEVPPPHHPPSDASRSRFPTTHGHPPLPSLQRVSPFSPPPKTPRHVEPDTHKDFLVIESGSWQRHYPGDPRIQLDLTRLISFYDTDLFPSLVPGRFGKPRWEHRLIGISKEDVQRMHTRLDEIFSPRGRRSAGSGVDWKAIVKVIMNRYGQRLELLQYVLQGNLTGVSQEEGQNYTAIAVEAHNYAAATLTPYILHTAVPPPDRDGYDLSWAKPVFRECSTAHTASIEIVFRSQLTPSELLILRSIQETTKEICRVLVRVWAEGSILESDRFRPSERASDGLHEVVRRWRRDVSGLMEWLAWDVWTTCRPACGFEEMCYLPTWPFLFLDQPAPPERWPPKVDGLPKPHCIRRLPPYTR